MLRKVVSVAVILFLSVGVVFADQFGALITKVEGNKVTFYPFEGKGKDAKKGEKKTLPAAEDVKVVKGKFNKETKKVEDDGEVEGGLKHRMFTELPGHFVGDNERQRAEKGIFAQITTDDDNKRIKEIRVFGGRKGQQQ
jgi:hypothetical protein